MTYAQIHLDAHADELTRELDAAGAVRVHLVGHSVGGVIAALFAARCPRRVASLISVEGNFTLADAYSSQSFARLGRDEAERVLAEDRANLAAWLRRADVEPDTRTLRLAERWLSFQPTSTAQAMAAPVAHRAAAGVDHCGENGEFHTFVSAGADFAQPIACETGEIVERDGFVFCDLTPA